MLGTGGNPLGGRGGVAGQGGSSMMPDPVSMWGCDNPVPLGNGFVSCASGMIHRPRIGNEACLSELPRTEALDATDYAIIEQAAQQRGLSLAQILERMNCIDDTDCADAPNGYCEVSVSELTDDLTECRYGCQRDSECGSGAVCLCGSPVGVCVPSSCTRNADCGTNLLCSSYDSIAGCGVFDGLAFACQTFDDECGANAHCGFAEPYCMPRGGRRECSVGTGCLPL